MHSLSGFIKPSGFPRRSLGQTGARVDLKLFSKRKRPNPLTANGNRFEVTSGLETGVVPGPDTKKSMNRGWSAADVNKGKPLKKMTIVEFLRISIGDLDNHYRGH
jgi:hypothetical protein